jgi:eukaryotic-like serine/threonine-protein kinase
MKPERWQRIEELYRSARELRDDQRDSFLRQACGGDRSLVEEVELLLKHGITPDSVLDEPTVEALAGATRVDGLQANAPQLEGKTISHYRVLQALGEGGMGVVYKAEDLKLRRYVALKFLPESLARDPEALQRFEREAQAASALNHPNICTVYEIDEADGANFIAIEFLEGETLKERMARAPLVEREIVQFAIDICDAVAAAHAAGIVHRDIKPANIFLTARASAKVLDFGVAKRIDLNFVEDTVDSSQVLTVSSDLRLTRTGTAVGTIAYMSPEQAAGQPIDARTDIFSLGAVLYEIVTGCLPFPGHRVADVLHAIQTVPPTPIEKLNPKVSPELVRIIVKAMQKARSLRYQRAAEMKADLEALRNRFKGAKADRKALWIPVAIALVLVTSAAVFSSRLRQRIFGRETPAGIKSIAVLPLDNLTGDSAQQYFVNGMTAALTTNLTKVGSLRVLSRESAEQIKSLHEPLREVAQRLGVDAILEGSVARAGNRVRISAQLVDIAKDQNVWAQEYDRDVQDVLHLQSEVAWDVVRQIRVRLTPQERERLERFGHCLPNAHDLYLQGMYYWYKASPEAYGKSLDYFDQAVRADPSCAEAYTGLGAYYAIEGDDGLMAPGEAWPKSRAAYAKAAELDPDLGDAYSGLGFVDYLYDWNWPQAEKDLKHALELNPGEVRPHRAYSGYLRIMRQFDGAIAESRQARDQSPLSVSLISALGWTYFYAHRWDEAIAQFRQALERDAQYLSAREGLVKCYQQKGMLNEALEELDTELRSADETVLAEAMRATYEKSGYSAALRTVYLTRIEQYRTAANEIYVSPIVFADLYSLLGQKDEAFNWLEKAYQEHSSKLIDLKVDSDYDNIRSDPRFGALVKKIGLP